MSLSVILTCYNEVPLVFDSYNKVVNLMDLNNIEYEVVIVDDGSSPVVQEQLSDYFRKKENVTLVFSDVNEGRGSAVTKGIKAASCEYAGFIDTDLNIPETYLLNLYSAIINASADIAIGKRKHILGLNLKELSREFISKVYFLLVNIILKLPFLDTKAGIKIFKRQKVLSILDSIQDKRWFWDEEIIAEGIKNNFKVIQEPVFARRTNRQSQVRIFRDAFRLLKSLYKYYKRQGHFTRNA